MSRKRVTRAIIQVRIGTAAKGKYLPKWESFLTGNRNSQSPAAYYHVKSFID
jgi:hypothetical protein